MNWNPGRRKPNKTPTLADARRLELNERAGARLDLIGVLFADATINNNFIYIAIIMMIIIMQKGMGQRKKQLLSDQVYSIKEIYEYEHINLNASTHRHTLAQSFLFVELKTHTLYI